ncbi:Gfo/Idh/MocA family protein [Streptosporangium sp. 'caverna']|uniref:Gfo/Idh/MocA family protein n=1 Tax=Streptosporangium sp. 'caverna' TaxID=2202249 RepID=UPI000D7E00ED|nr:Gfo/Idh/MocA family oxidoreductase [Streptosporangium sp. 'caverna']AWS41752.1 oxidoreductase [Streptosporangium sp. 'caverna']
MSASGPMGVGVIGAGKISDQYLENLTRFPDVEVRIVADLYPERAAEQAAAYGVPESGLPEQALQHPDVEIIVNLTIPAAHAEVSMAALDAGKHVWTEKPFSLDRASGQRLLEKAESAGLRIGGAPDTFLGAGLQTARRMIERGDIGVPLTGLTLFEVPGPVDDHRNLEVLLSRGAGPLWDMGPYYLTALTQCFGSFRSVVAAGRIARPTRVLQVGPKTGQEITVQVPTHVSIIAEFESGQSSTSVLSWDSPHRRVGHVEIVGSEATLSIPDPNHFDGDLHIRRAGDDDWTTVPAVGPVGGRGLGTLDIARAVRAQVPHRASGRLAYHVVDTMAAVSESIERGEAVSVRSSVPATETVGEDWDPYLKTL